jgi:hypothetical protein
MVQNNPDAGAGAYPTPTADPGAFRLAFGRHAGRTLAYLGAHHPSYLAWLLKTAYDPKTREALRAFSETAAGKAALTMKAKKNRSRTRNQNPADDWIFR